MNLNHASLKVIEAAKAGDVVFIECDVALCEDQMASLSSYGKTVTEKTGVHLVVLGRGLRAVSRPDDTEVDDRLALDRRMFGSSFERVRADGVRERIPPWRVTISNDGAGSDDQHGTEDGSGGSA